jgi:hypothetical protein
MQEFLEEGGYGSCGFWCARLYVQDPPFVLRRRIMRISQRFRIIFKNMTFKAYHVSRVGLAMKSLRCKIVFYFQGRWTLSSAFVSGPIQYRS